MRGFDRAGIRTIFTLHGGHLDAIYQAARERDVRSRTPGTSRPPAMRPTAGRARRGNPASRS